MNRIEVFILILIFTIEIVHGANLLNALNKDHVSKLSDLNLKKKFWYWPEPGPFKPPYYPYPVASCKNFTIFFF